MKYVEKGLMNIEKVKLDSALYIVATPIGNLKDITLRALEVLSSADIIVCEDTRVSKKLFDAYGIKVEMTVYNDHSKKSSRDKITSLISSGKAVALVSDAGMPLISDPGYKLVLDCYEKNLEVTTCPGANSILPAIALSGLPSNNFYFGGFLPQNLIQKQNFFRELQGYKTTLIFMDRASRLTSSVEAAYKVFGDVTTCIVREITKLYEERIFLPAEDMIKYLNENQLKGEIILLIDNSLNKKDLSQEDIDLILSDLLSDNTVKSASEMAFLEHGINKKLAYKRLLELKDN